MQRSVDSMFEYVLYASFSCNDARAIVQRMNANQNISSTYRSELVQTIKDSKPLCNWGKSSDGTQSTEGTGLKSQPLETYHEHPIYDQESNQSCSETA